MTLREYLSIPYVFEIATVHHPDKGWFRRATYPELPDCIAEDVTLLDAIQRLEEKRLSCILRMIEQKAVIPVPRPPLLREMNFVLEPLTSIMQRLGYHQWAAKLDMDLDNVNANSFGKVVD